MWTYCVSFRIADRTVSGLTYSERRQRLVDNVHSDGFGYWEETTSFIVVQSNKDTQALARDAAAGLSAQYDMLFVFDPSDMSAACFGAIQYFDVLKSLFPKLQRVQ